MKVLNLTTFILTVIGALNWGLIGLFKFNLVGFIFGDMSITSRIIYILVGLAGIYTFMALYGLIFDET